MHFGLGEGVGAMREGLGWVVVGGGDGGGVVGWWSVGASANAVSGSWRVKQATIPLVRTLGRDGIKYLGNVG